MAVSSTAIAAGVVAFLSSFRWALVLAASSSCAATIRGDSGRAAKQLPTFGPRCWQEKHWHENRSTGRRRAAGYRVVDRPYQAPDHVLVQVEHRKVLHEAAAAAAPKR